MRTEPTPANRNPPADLLSLCLSIAEHAPSAMAAVEGAGHIVRYANPAFCRLIDQPNAELIGKPFCDILPEKSECVAFLDRVLRTGKAETHTESEHSKPHPAFWSYTMWPVVANEQSVGIMIQVTETSAFHEKMVAMNEALLLGSVRQHELVEAADSSNALLQVEIRDRKQSEKALQQARAQLADRATQLEGRVTERTVELTAMNQQLEAFVYSIAHDLRAPLRAIQGFSAMLVEEAGAALNETGKGYAARIDKSTQYMDAMLIDLLSFSLISQQRIELSLVKLETVVESVLSDLEKEIHGKAARVESAGSWPIVVAHEPTLNQVLFNLMSNALKFVTANAPPRIRLRAEERGAVIRVLVEDRGPGIAPHHREQIFRLFSRLNGEAYPGTGIGLAIVQRGVERMGGRVGVESDAGQGSRFWFELPKG